MSTRTTRKRARTDADEDSADVKPDPSNPAISADEADATGLAGVPIPLKKDEEFWFEDGTVILHAGDVEFRVYGGLLESHSAVFKELLAQSHPTRAVSIAGRTDFLCPVIKLPDSPHDLRHVLQSCMPKQSGRSVGFEWSVRIHVDISDSLYGTPTPSFDMVSATIRLGQKYKITHMYQKGLTFLKGHFTDDFDSWMAIGSWCPPNWDEVQAIGVINLARLTGELSLLPTAFMACALLPDMNPVHGFTREDGSRESLTLDDLGLCFEAKGRLREAGIAALHRVLDPTVSPKCTTSPQCAKAFKMIFRGNKIEKNVNCMMTQDVLLYTASNYFTNDGEEDKYTICQACLDMLQERDEKGNRALWDRLPELLGIEVPGWKKAEVPPASPAAN